jgi:hypothetical protein
MRAPTTAAVIACPGLLGVNGCSSSGQSCSVVDNGAVGAPGFATPRQALRSVLATHPQWLSVRGWVMAERTAHGVTFRSGNDSVDVVKTSTGDWIIGGITACQ